MTRLPTFDTGPCTCATLRRAARAITQFYDDALAPSGLLITQFSLLRAIERRTESSISALADRVGLERSTLTRNLALLADDGLIRIGPRAGRANPVTLTAKGRARIVITLKLWERAESRMRKILGLKALAGVNAARRTLEALGKDRSA